MDFSGPLSELAYRPCFGSNEELVSYVIDKILVSVVKHDWDWIQVMLCTSCVSLDKSLNFSESWSLLLK